MIAWGNVQGTGKWNVKSNPITSLDRPWGFQWVEVPRFQDNRHMKVVRLSALRTGRLYPQEIFLVLIVVRGWVDPRSLVRPKGCQRKIPVKPSGMKMKRVIINKQYNTGIGKGKSKGKGKVHPTTGHEVPLACWDRGFESHRGHGYLSAVSVVCCQVEVSATSWSLIQRSPTDCGASLCVI